MNLLTKKQQILNENTKICYNVGKFDDNMLQIINITKLETLPLFTGIQKVMDQENKFINQFNKL